jgi:chromosome segregation ATPase
MEDDVRPPSPIGTASPLSNEALRELQQRAAAALSASREQTVRLEADITRQLDEIAATISDQLVADENSASAATEQREAEIARLAQELRTTRDEATAEREALQRERDELAERVEELRASQEAARVEREALMLERAALASERDELVKRAEDLESRNQGAQGEWRDQLLQFEAKLRDQQTLWNEQRGDWLIVRTSLERERDELQNKFKLALEDVQRLRERVAELEHDLARRPEAAQADSAELVALRAERDALSERVAELEQRPATQIDADTEQQLADLQRRFEMAVEDVRELKTKNAKLESQLAAAGSTRPAAAAPDTGGMDWESQKRRLLAALDDGDDSAEAPTQQERATIAGTIEMTDAVVAEKDRQIAELTAELEAARNNPMASDDAQNEKLNELLDTDAVITEHRKRAQHLEKDMEAKLRAAELEISVERAKIARQKVELEELRVNLESQRQMLESAGSVATPGAPRRRWLSKLGIDGKERE